MSRLPANWESVIFEDAFEYLSKTGRKAGEGLYQGKYKFFTSSQTQSKYLDEHDFDGDHLVFGTGGMPSVHHCSEKFSTSTDCFVVKATDKTILPRYVYYFFKGNIEILERGFRGAGLKHLSRPYLNSIKIPKPSVETQKKIVAILEKAERVVKLREDADRLTDDYLKAVFYNMFGDPKSNHRKLKLGKIRDLILEANYGTSKKADENKGKYPILRMNNLTYEGRLDFSDLKYIDFDPSEEEKYLVGEGELLFNRTNSKELVGKCAVFRRKEKMAFAGYLVKLKTKNKAISEYISAYLNSPHGKAILFNKAKSIVGMANINAQEVQEIPILIPDGERLEQFEDIINQVEKLRMNQISSKVEIKNLFDALMQSAFKGELVV